MYLLSQMALFLLLAFLLGVSTGYALWRTWGQREIVAKFNTAELKLATHLQRFEKTARDGEKQARASGEQEARRASLERQWEEAARRELTEFEAKHAAMLKETQDTAVRNAEAAAEKKVADLAKVLGYPPRPPGSDGGVRLAEDVPKREPVSMNFGEASAVAAVSQLRSKAE